MELWLLLAYPLGSNRKPLQGSNLAAAFFLEQRANHRQIASIATAGSRGKSESGIAAGSGPPRVSTRMNCGGLGKASAASQPLWISFTATSASLLSLREF